MPPSIPGLGTQGGFSFWLQDRSGGIARVPRRRTCRSFWTRRASGRSWPASPRSSRAAVPQMYADVDRDKVLKQGVALGDVYQTMQAFLGGLYVNQFNRFGRQWRVFLQAEGADAHECRPTIGAVLRPQQRRRRWCRSRRSRRPSRRSGRSTRTASTSTARAQITGAPAPGYSSGQALDALEDVARTDAAAARSATTGRTCRIRRSKRRRHRGALFALSLAFVFLILAALYESWSLPFSVLLSVPIAVFGAFARPAAAPATTSTSTRRSASIMLIGLAAKNAILIVEFAKARARRGHGAGRCRARRRAAAAAADSDDVVRVHPRLRAAVGRDRLRRRVAPHPRHGRHHRHAGGDAASRSSSSRCCSCWSSGCRRARWCARRIAHAISVPGEERAVIATIGMSTAHDALVAWLLVAYGAAGCTVGPNYRRPPVDVPGHVPRPDRAGRRAGARRSATSAGRQRVRRRDAADADPDRARAQLRRAASPRREFCEAQAQLGITRADQFPTRRRPASTSLGERPSAALGFPSRNIGAVEVQAIGRRGSSISGASYRRATEAARAQLLASEWGRRAVRHHARQPGGARLLRPARARSRARHLAADAGVAAGVAAADAGARAGRRHLARRRAPGRAAGLRRNGEIATLEREIEQQENFISVLLGGNPGPIARGRALDRSAARARRAGRAAVGAARTAAGHPAGRAAARRRQRPNRRREGGVFPADRADRIGRVREHGAVGAVHRHERDLGGGRRRRRSRSSPPAARDRRWRSPRRGARRR